MADRFAEYAAEFKLHPESWPAAWAAVDARHEKPEPAPVISEAYMRGLSGDEITEKVFAYQRASGLPVEQAAAAFDVTLEDRPAALDNSGLVTEQPQHYARSDDPVTEDVIARMLAAAEDDGYTPEELRHLEHLLRRGMDPVDAYLRAGAAKSYSERERMRPSPLHPEQSTETSPEYETAGGGGLDQDFIRDMGTTVLSSGPTLTGPYHQHPVPPRPGGATFKQAFKAHERPGRSPLSRDTAAAGEHGLEPPEPGSPAGYQRGPHKPEMTEEHLERCLAHMRKHNVGFEEAQHYFAEQEKKRVLKSYGMGKLAGDPAAPVGRPMETTRSLEQEQHHATGRERFDYARGGSDDEAARRRRFDLPGRPCLGFSSRPAGDGGTILEPLYA
jgi:hypothetical protein